MNSSEFLFKQEIVANVSSAVPRFTAGGLIPGHTYAAAVLAYNAKGRGDPYPLRASTLRPPEKHHVHDKSLGNYCKGDSRKYLHRPTIDGKHSNAAITYQLSP